MSLLMVGYISQSARKMIDCSEFWDLVNYIETLESKSNSHWNAIQKEARFAERVKAYEKMFYRFLDGVNVS